ncbi:MAG: peptidoglycan DD-metalloendopeptidase family protein [Phycisphaeraceae bacterium]|nr:peptidoglycan DD-metalloendopeptidase family protein [Phycisphaeraceae bacterium]
MGNRETNVTLYATYDGRVTTFRNAPKFRHYLALTKNIVADNGDILGKIVTVYAHLDLDLDKASGLSLDGAIVKKGDTISKHLYAGTKGGPHLHFEIRYYRPKTKVMKLFTGLISEAIKVQDSAKNPQARGTLELGIQTSDMALQTPEIMAFHVIKKSNASGQFTSHTHRVYFVRVGRVIRLCSVCVGEVSHAQVLIVKGITDPREL